MHNTLPDALGYYAEAGAITDPSFFAPLLDAVSKGIPGVVKAVQGLLVHINWAEHYGLNLSDEREQEMRARTVVQKLDKALGYDSRPLTEGRELENRLVANSRDYSVLLCAMLRHQGVPARARCGFATYFVPDQYEDHWVCEHWNADEKRWVLVDAQLDAMQRRALRISFNQFDVPRDKYLVAGKAWQMCRAGQADPDKFGLLEWRGLWFVRNNLVRDLLALNKIELLPWDRWGLMADSQEPLTPVDAELLDRIAALTQGGNETLGQVLSLVSGDARLQAAPNWQP